MLGGGRRGLGGVGSSWEEQGSALVGYGYHKVNFDSSEN